jgi:transcriptional regulator with XRE-family HTH domain
MVSTQQGKAQKAPVLVAFGETVRRHRKALGFSQEAFADECGIDRSYMGGIERGERNLAMLNVMRIIHALGIQPSDFFRSLDQPKKRKSRPT